MANLSPGVFDDLEALRFLFMHHNELTALPQGLFVGLTSMRWLWAHENPGAPFPIRADPVARAVPASDAHRIARVAVEAQMGAPFDMTLELSVTGGVADSSTLLIATGDSSSRETATITRTGDEPVSVSLKEAPLPTRMCARQSCYQGLKSTVGGPLRLFDSPPMVIEQIANQEIGLDGDTVTLNLARYFSDLDSLALDYAVTSSDTAVTSVTVTGNQATITSAGDTGGTATITVSATDSDGHSAAVEFTVAVLAEFTRNRWRGWRLAAVLAATTQDEASRAASESVATD